MVIFYEPSLVVIFSKASDFRCVGTKLEISLIQSKFLARFNYSYTCLFPICFFRNFSIMSDLVSRDTHYTACPFVKCIQVRTKTHSYFENYCLTKIIFLSVL